MFDPGALGTLLNLREAERREADLYRRGIAQLPPPPKRRLERVRRRLAATLHRTADLISPTPAGLR